MCLFFLAEPCLVVVHQQKKGKSLQGVLAANPPLFRRTSPAAAAWKHTWKMQQALGSLNQSSPKAPCGRPTDGEVLTEGRRKEADLVSFIQFPCHSRFL
jgi:hypothetical protein